jgi:hypothetical protein
MWSRKMRDDERVKCGRMEVEKGNDNLQVKDWQNAFGVTR